jgi:hypothetical protein
MPSAFCLRRLLGANLSALALRPPEGLRFSENLLLTGLHGIGLFALARYFHIPWLPTLALLSAVLLSLLAIRRTVMLAPFFFVYGSLLLRYAFIRIWHGTVGGYFDYIPPEWGLALFRIEAATLAAGIYSALLGAVVVLKSRRRAAWMVALILFALTLVWAGVKYFGQRTRGTTGSDPYAYAQMGIDLATRGTPAHRFALFPEIAPLNIAWYPLLHVSYHLPVNDQGNAVTVFPAGGAFAYALFYRIFGEEGLYWVNPLFSLLCALAAGLLAWGLTRKHDRVLRSVVAAATCALVATANEQVVWAGITMVDSQAELFSILALYFALRAEDSKSIRFPLLAGSALAAAYWVRHTQIILAPCLLLLFWQARDTFAGRVRAIVASGGAALLLALGDLWYHQSYLGGWLHPESEELALFSLTVIGETANRLYQQVFAAYEFGWLAPFLVYGALLFARRARLEFWALAVWIGLSLAIHLPYAALRLRDLLPEFPAIAFLAAYGVCAIAAQVMSGRRMQLITGVVTFGLLELLVLRVWNTVPQAWQPPRPIFGYVTESQRAAFNQLIVLTSADAVIGSTLNDGAIELYTRRDTFRPDSWNSYELREFIRAMRVKHPSVYLLEDGSAMDSVLEDLRRDYLLTRVGTLEVPLFGDARIAQPGALWKIEE